MTEQLRCLRSDSFRLRQGYAGQVGGQVGGFRKDSTVAIHSFVSVGGFTIPGKFRDLLRLSTGSKMIIVCDGEHLLLKPIKQPEAQVFRPIIQQLQKLEARTKKAVK